jgi:hypothetical protein
MAKGLIVLAALVLAASSSQQVDPTLQAVTKSKKLVIAGKYLPALDTLEAVDPGDKAMTFPLAFELSCTRSFVDDGPASMRPYDAAMLAFHIPASPPADLPPGLKPISAIRAIVREARTRQIVILNEMHFVPMHRAFALQLAEALRGIGYRYLALEDLHEDLAQLTRDGYPRVDGGGSFTMEPEFGDLIRHAMAIGYKPVPYEIEMSQLPASKDPNVLNAARESAQAQNIIDRVLKKDPKAKIFVYVGFQHVSKKAGEQTAGASEKYMALRLKELSGIDPLCIDQISAIERTDPTLELPAYRTLESKGLVTEPMVFQHPSNSYFTPGEYDGGVDMVVFHPRIHLVGGRPDWLAMRGYRKPVQIPKRWRQTRRTLLQAFRTGEQALAVPVDQVMIDPGQKVVLMLPAGSYRICSQDDTGKTTLLGSIAVR